MPIGKPNGAEGLRGLGDDDGQAAGDGNFPQLSAAEESNPPSVRRKERRARIVGTGKGARIQLIERAHVQATRRIARRLRDQQTIR